MRPSNRFWLALCNRFGCISLFLGALAVRSRFAAGIRLETHPVRRIQSPHKGEAHGTVIGQTPAHLGSGSAVRAAPTAFCMDKKSLFLAVNGLFCQPPTLGLPGGLEPELP